MQLMARELGGAVEANDVSEYGKADVELDGTAALFHDLAAEQVVWMSHRDSVTAAPPGARVTASSETTPIAAFEDPARALYGVQFHPEVVHTPQGQRILESFLYDVAGAPAVWTPAAVIEEQVERIRAQVGSERVICGLSGGVDSAVAALLVHKAVGDQLTCVFVDHGLLRENEAEQVVETFGGHFQVPLVHVDARERFLTRLAGCDGARGEAVDRRRGVHPRVRGGGRKLGDVRFLVQGTLYSDVIESGGEVGVAAKIKSHHNVGGLPADMRMELVEPLRSLFKDEVQARRRAARPPRADGLAAPVPGARPRDPDHRRRDRGAARDPPPCRRGAARGGAQGRPLPRALAVLRGAPAIRSVGVQGDERTYAYPIVIRAVTSEDAMTADWARLPYELLDTISSRIVNEVAGVNRVALDLSSKPPATIEWE